MRILNETSYNNTPTKFINKKSDTILQIGI
jgi:hypothetical protein